MLCRRVEVVGLSSLSSYLYGFPTFPATLLTKASDDTIVMGNLGYFQARRLVTWSCWS